MIAGDERNPVDRDEIGLDRGDLDRVFHPATHNRPAVLLTAGLAILLGIWTLAMVVSGQMQFVVFSPKAEIGEEAATALAALFGAVVLFLFPADRSDERLRWVGGGFVVLALGTLIFGYLEPLLNVVPTLNTSVYASLAVRTLAGIILFMGLVPTTAPRFSPRSVLLTIAILGALSATTIAAVDDLPPLIHGTHVWTTAVRINRLRFDLTGWYWVISLLPLGLSLIATVGAVRLVRERRLGTWLLGAMVLLTASQLHTMFWPSAFSPLVTTSQLLRFAFAIVVAIGGLLELRRIAAERTALLAAEQEHSRRLADLGVLKADFTAMVVHELGSPLGAIRGWSEMLATGELSPEEQQEALAAIQGQTAVLTSLVSDVQLAASVERDDFVVQPRVLPISILLADAAAFAKSLPGHHPLILPPVTYEMVRADPERIAQVLRNLLSNAAKYSTYGAPIELRIARYGGHVRVEVVDQGFGIRSDEILRIFEKFGRGRDHAGRKVPGVGLGLYLSRRIVQAHGSDLTVRSEPNVGSTFGFDLETMV